MNYKQALEYLYSQLPMFHRVGAAAYKADLNNTIALCNLLNHPYQSFKSIHIAGTNGKGSVSHFIASILQESGLKVGLYTSPHLKDFRERIKINGKMIPETYVVNFINKYQNEFERIQPSFFETTVGMAFQYFKEEKVDIAVIETGLGGRLDSTNIISPLLSVITNIGYDHTNLLGNTIEEIAKGVEKKIKVNKYITCDTCNGTGAKGGNAHRTCSTCRGTGHVTRITNTILGQMQSTSTCPECGGEGQIITDKCNTCFGNGIIKGEEVINLNIPAGVTEGMQLSLGGKGNSAARGGVAGDLIVVIEEVIHPELKREGNNLLYDHFISFPEAALGTSIEIPTIEGKVRIKIDAGTQSGKVLRLKGKGLPSINSYGKGDLLVNINVWTPKSLSKEEKAILEKLDKSENFIPRPTSSDKSFFDRMKEYFS